jgi:hypothetical protein
MRYVVILMSVALTGACGSQKGETQGNAATLPFLDGLTVTKSTPIEVRCPGGGARVELRDKATGLTIKTEVQDFVLKSPTKEAFQNSYKELRQAVEKGEKYGYTLNQEGSVADRCDVIYEGRVLETWTRQ